MAARLLTVVLGVWLMAAPDILGYGEPARTVDRIVGPLVASFAIIALWEVTRPVQRANALLGAWLVVAPWALGYDGAGFVNSLVAGAVVVLLALLPRAAPDGGADALGGGWSVLWRRSGRRVG